MRRASALAAGRFSRFFFAGTAAQPSSAGASAGASTIGGGGSSRAASGSGERASKNRSPSDEDEDEDSSSLSAGGAAPRSGMSGATARAAAARSAAAFFRSFWRFFFAALVPSFFSFGCAASPRGVDAGVPYTVAGVVGVASSSLHDVDGAAGFGALGGEGRASRSLGATRNRARRARRPAGGSRTIRFEYTAPGSYFLNKSLRWAPARFDARSPRSFAARSRSIWPDT